MRRVNNNSDAYKNIMKVAKRIAITILCCVPAIIIFGYLTRNIITSDSLQIVCFTLIMGTAVLIEELVVRAKEKRKAEQDMIEPKKDVFR